jgi:dolichyl-diphosphooligosaccharide--protein glycosyltransferase
VKDSHNIARHLADYVLVWSTRFVGNGGDDIAKSPHMARIGGSVFKDVKANEFYIDRQGRPSRMMRESLVYNLVLNRFDPSVPPISSDYYQEVYTSPNRMVRVYKVMRVSKDSKRYCAENRGYKAWLAGTPLLEAYPPGLKSVLSKREAFEQLEDFNARKSAPAGSTKTSSSGEGKMKSKSSKKQTQSTSSK